MDCTSISIVREAAEKVPDVDNERVLDWRCPYPFVLLVEYLKPTKHVLPQQRKALEVCV